jgi:hypothetical protein
MTDVGRPAPEVYRLSMEKLPFAVARERRLAATKLFLVATAGIALVRLLVDTPQEAVDVSAAVLTLAVLGLPYVLWAVGRRVRRRWNAFELSIGPESMRAAAKGAGRITIRHDQVTEVIEGGTGLHVRSSEPGLVLHVPRTVEGYLDVRARLGALRPIRPRADARAWCLAALVGGARGAASAPRWGYIPGLGVGVVATQLAFAVFVGCEVHAHPHLGRGAKAAALALVALAGLAPLAGLVRI